jgi:hypothetical protein
MAALLSASTGGAFILVRRSEVLAYFCTNWEALIAAGRPFCYRAGDGRDDFWYLKRWLRPPDVAEVWVGELAKAPRPLCGAKTRKGTPCQARATCQAIPCAVMTSIRRAPRPALRSFRRADRSPVQPRPRRVWCTGAQRGSLMREFPGFRFPFPWHTGF